MSALLNQIQQTLSLRSGPMLGFSFSTFVRGAILGLVLFLFPITRRFYTFAFIPIMGGIGAVILCLPTSLILEYSTNTRIGGYGFFGGYILGGILGALLGLRVAMKYSRTRRRN